MALTLKKVKDKRKFVYENEALEITKELTAEEIDLISEMAETVKHKIEGVLKKYNAESYDQLKPAGAKAYDKALAESEKIVASEDVAAKIAGADPEEIKEHFKKSYGEVLGAKKYKLFIADIMAKAFEFVNTPS